MFKQLLHFFDKLEDKIRSRLSHHPLVYALVGGIAIVLFWRGVWHLADDIGLSSWASFIISAILLLLIGLFTSVFIGDQIILSGLRQEKKITDKTEQEVETEKDILLDVREELEKIEDMLEDKKKG